MITKEQFTDMCEEIADCIFYCDLDHEETRQYLFKVLPEMIPDLVGENK